MKPDKDGVTERQHLEQVEKQTGRRPKALNGPEFPSGLEYIWSSFFEASKGRSSGFSGPNPLSYQELESWMRLTQTPLTPRDISVIKRLDQVYMKVMMNG